MKSIQVSIIVPVFNAELHLELLLTALLNQSISSIEIIAIDDGSTDRSLEILRRFSLKDERILVLTQNNSGVSAARNHGLQFARGEWIAFADSDDWIDPSTLETWQKFAEKNSLDLVIGNGFRFLEKPNEITRTPILKKQPWDSVITGEEWIKRSVASNEWPHYVWLQLINRSLLNKNNFLFNKNIIHEDIIWTLQIALASKRVGFMKNPLYGYRINPQSITEKMTEDAFQHRAQSYIFIMDYLVVCAKEKISDEILRRALLRHTNREGGHFLGLMRKRVTNPSVRRSLSQKFFKLGLSNAMFQGAENATELWRAIRCWFLLKKFASL